MKMSCILTISSSDIPLEATHVASFDEKRLMRGWGIPASTADLPPHPQSGSQHLAWGGIQVCPPQYSGTQPCSGLYNTWPPDNLYLVQPDSSLVVMRHKFAFGPATDILEREEGGVVLQLTHLKYSKCSTRFPSLVIVKQYSFVKAAFQTYLCSTLTGCFTVCSRLLV
ncbi:hypothetical protein ElyMa_004669500 [Elysia marginata]|uniref:Uncharacterized protein n=1 Tax=Elysia marginata TaxID=1093978 RepID=A0AAV4I3H3_9GAST|nr:hypothetical protein ElyMa_004669500 [Elysia marginata]